MKHKRLALPPTASEIVLELMQEDGYLERNEKPASTEFQVQRSEAMHRQRA